MLIEYTVWVKALSPKTDSLEDSGAITLRSSNSNADMDYTQHAGSISQAADVWRMVFYHWQWEQMRNTGKTNGYLVLNSN